MSFANRIKCCKFMLREATREFCDKNIPIKVKGKFYNTIVRPPTISRI